MKQFSILWLRKRGMSRVLSAMGISSAVLLGCLPALGQVPYVEARNQGVVSPVIDFQRQALTLSLPIVGVPFRLNYRSDALAPKWRWSIYHAYDPGGDIFSPGNGRPRPANPLFGQTAKAPQWLAIGELAIAARDGSEIYIFNQRGNHLRTLNTLTGALVCRFDYSAAGTLTAIEDGYGNTTRIERDTAGFMTAVVAPHGQRTTFSNNAKGYPTQITDPLGETTSLDYSSDGQLIVLTDPNKNVYRFTADQAGFLTKIEKPAGGFVDLTQTLTENRAKLGWTTAMERQSASLVERTPDGATTALNTDPVGAQTQIQTGTDGTAKIAYPDGGTLTRSQQPDLRWGLQSPVLKTLSLATPSGFTSAVAANRTVRLADSNNPLSLTTLTDTTLVNGHTYVRTIDARSRQITQITPSGRRIVTTLDDHSQVVKVEVPGMLPISLTYNGQGQLTSFKQGAGTDARLVSLAYSENGWLTAVTDPLKRTVRFEHDSAGRVSKRILPDGSELALKYDANGNLASLTPPGRPSHSFEYTPVGEIRAYLPPHVNQSSGSAAGKNNLWNSITSFLTNIWSTIKFYVQKLFRSEKAASSSVELAPGNIAYEYNQDGQLVKIARAEGATEIAYDKGGRLTSAKGPGRESSFTYNPKTTQRASVTSSDGVTLAWTYDGPLLTRLDWTGSVKGTVGFTYDSDLRTSSTSLNGDLPTTLEYDPDGLLIGAGNLKLIRDGSSGLLARAVLGNVTTAQEYNSFEELTALRGNFKNREIFSDRYERDLLGRVVRKTETIDSKSDVYTYGYDSAGRLTDVTTNGTTTAHYDYDSNGNRTRYVGPTGTVKASYDAQDRLEQYGSATYAHTATGELLSKTIQGRTTRYSYDDLGNLKAASLPDGIKIEYLMDGENRRIGKKVNDKLVEGFLYEDQLKIVAELDGQNQVAARFVYATQANVPDYVVKDGKTYRILADTLGSPRIVMDADTGAVAQRIDYDEFGNVLRDTNPGFQPFGFAGGLYDRHTGLTHFGARDYDAATGRWTAKDPILFVTAETNLYSYVASDPVNLSDCTGLDPSWLNSINSWAAAKVVGDLGVIAAALLNYGNASVVTGATATALGFGAEAGGASLVGVAGTAFAPVVYPFGMGVGAAATAFWGTTAAVAGAGAGLGWFGGQGINWFYRNASGQSLGEDWADIRMPSGGDLAGWWHCHGFGSGDASGCGRGTGDIHMETLDGLRYDMQAAGEFVASQDPTGQVKIQIRLEPDDSRRVSFCTAVAAMVDGARVAIHLKPQLQLYVDGQTVKLEPGRGMRLGKSGEITFSEALSWVIAWPDGTAVKINSEGSYFDLIVQPGSSAGKLVGLLGKGDGNPKGALVTRKGVVLGTGFSSAELYGGFAESWRISQDESLFHYAKGESTSTFTDRSVPHENVTVASLDPATRAEAERVCRAAGISSPASLAECTLDFAVTGDRRFLSSAALAQAISREQVTIKLDSGVRLDTAQGLGPLWQWWLVVPGKADQAVQRQNGDQQVMLVPPGEYQVVTQPTQFSSQSVVWPQKIQVQPGQQVTIKVNSGVRMSGPPGASPNFEFQFLNAQKQKAQWGQQTWKTQVLPPGTYSLQIRHPFGQWKTVAEQVQVREGQIAEVHISELPPQ